MHNVPKTAVNAACVAGLILLLGVGCSEENSRAQQARTLLERIARIDRKAPLPDRRAQVEALRSLAAERGRPREDARCLCARRMAGSSRPRASRPRSGSRDRQRGDQDLEQKELSQLGLRLAQAGRSCARPTGSCPTAKPAPARCSSAIAELFCPKFAPPAGGRSPATLAAVVHPIRVSFLVLLLAGLAGCGNPIQTAGARPSDESGEKALAAAEPAEAITPPFAVSGELDGLLLVWFDAEGPHPASRRSEVPESRAQSGAGRLARRCRPTSGSTPSTSTSPTSASPARTASTRSTSTRAAGSRRRSKRPPGAARSRRRQRRRHRLQGGVVRRVQGGGGLSTLAQRGLRREGHRAGPASAERDARQGARGRQVPARRPRDRLPRQHHPRLRPGPARSADPSALRKVL